MIPIQPITRIADRRDTSRASTDRRKPADIREEAAAIAGVNRFLDLFKAELRQRGSTLDIEA